MQLGESEIEAAFLSSPWIYGGEYTCVKIYVYGVDMDAQEARV